MYVCVCVYVCMYVCVCMYVQKTMEIKLLLLLFIASLFGKTDSAKNGPGLENFSFHNNRFLIYLWQINGSKDYKT